MSLFKKHIPESLALASVFAVSISLQVAWIINLLVARNLAVREWLTFAPDFGALSGIFFVTVVVYLVSLFAVLLWYRHRDCSHQREHVLWVFVISIILFTLMTTPGIYSVTITDAGL